MLKTRIVWLVFMFHYAFEIRPVYISNKSTKYLPQPPLYNPLGRFFCNNFCLVDLDILCIILALEVIWYTPLPWVLYSPENLMIVIINWEETCIFNFKIFSNFCKIKGGYFNIFKLLCFYTNNYCYMYFCSRFSLFFVVRVL